MWYNALGAVVGCFVGVVSLTIAAPRPAHAACGDVVITEMSWASGAIVTAISSFLMEHGYGCRVKKIPISGGPALTSVAETGRPDILTELWVNSNPAYVTLEEAGRISALTEVLSDGGVEGWWIPRYLAEAHPELRTIDGILAHPEWVGGRFQNCPDGWRCRIVNGNLMKAFDFAGHGIKPFQHGSGETLAASLGGAYENREPWFGYYWAPTAILGKYDMVLVDMGPHVPDVHDCNRREDCETPGRSAYPRGRVVTAVTAAFAEREPAATELMRHLSFTNWQMGEILAWQQANKASPEESAVHFLTTYKDVWRDWLSDEARVKLAGVLN